MLRGASLFDLGQFCRRIHFVTNIGDNVNKSGIFVSRISRCANISLVPNIINIVLNDVIFSTIDCCDIVSESILCHFDLICRAVIIVNKSSI